VAKRKGPVAEATAPMGIVELRLAALLRAPLLGFCGGGFFSLGEEVDLLGDDLASVSVGAILVGPFGIMNSAGYHYHCALGDMLRNAFADAVEAGYPVPFGFALAVSFTVIEAAAGGERDAGD
jgi:hypothetical protein